MQDVKLTTNSFKIYFNIHNKYLNTNRAHSNKMLRMIQDMFGPAIGSGAASTRKLVEIHNTPGSFNFDLVATCQGYLDSLFDLKYFGKCLIFYSDSDLLHVNITFWISSESQFKGSIITYMYRHKFSKKTASFAICKYRHTHSLYMHIVIALHILHPSFTMPYVLCLFMCTHTSGLLGKWRHSWMPNK